MLLGYNDSYVGAPAKLFQRTVEGKASVIRWPIDWSTIQKEEGGPFDWTAQDAVYKEGRARSLTLAPNLTNSPQWARPGNSAPIAPPDEAHNTSWEKFTKEFAKRFSPGVVEIWNEPNMPPFWGGPPNAARMADLFNRAHKMIRGNSGTTTLILSPGLVPVPGNVKAQAEYFNEFKAKVEAGLEYGAAVHLYSFKPCSSGGQVENCLEQLDAFKAAAGGRRLWVTETGFSSGKASESGCTPERQASEHASNWAGCVNRGVETYIVYRLVDSPTDSGTPYEHDGVVSAEYVNKPAFTKLKELA